MGKRLKQKNKLKKKISLFLIVILSLQLFLLNQNLVKNNAFVPPKENKYSINNIGVPNYRYDEILIDDNLVYLYGNDFIDLMNISNLKDIKKAQTIELETYLFWYIYDEHVIYDLENKTIYYYDIDYFDRNLSLTTFHHNNTHVIETKNYSYNISTNHTIFREYSFFQNENTLYLVMLNRSSSPYIDDIKIQISLLTIDITNKTQPEIIASPVLLYNSTGLKEWGENDFYSVNRNTFSYFNDQLYYLRAYLSHENIDNHYHPDNAEFSYGYIKAWNISNHTNPQEVFTIEIDQWFYSHVIISNNFMFYCSSNSGFLLYNCTNKQDIQFLSKYQINDTPKQIIFSDDLYYLICSGSIHILDITNPEKIKKIGEYKTIFQGNGGFHKGVLIEKILYLTRSSEYRDRCFYVIDCSNSKNPKRLFPSGRRLSKETIWNLTVYSMFIGPPVGVIIIIVATVLLVRRRRRKKELIPRK